MTGKHVEGVPKITAVKAAVPPPCGIGVRKMPVTGTIKDSVFCAFTDFVTVRIGMCMHAGAVPGDSSAIFGYKPKLHRGDDGCDRKEFLKKQLIVEREIPS